MTMSGKSKRIRKSAEEAENMMLYDQDSGSSDINLVEDLSDNGWDACSDLDA